jgi:uncharacterized protein (DUF2236 family)
VSDRGYFGPDSVTWRITREPLTLVGGLRALLLQALHPEAMALMSAKSRFRDEPWERLRRTAEYVAVVSFGTTDEVEQITRHVRAVHAALGIKDPELLAWVHACQVDSFLTAARRSGVAVSATDADAYLTEQAAIAGLVGVPAEQIPRSAFALDAYFAGMRPRLRLTPEAVEAARFVVAPPIGVPLRFILPARLGWTTIASLAVGLLPPWARRMYRLPPMLASDLATTAGMRGLRTAIRALPERYREGPHYRAAKERLRQAG